MADPFVVLVRGTERVQKNAIINGQERERRVYTINILDV